MAFETAVLSSDKILTKGRKRGQATFLTWLRDESVEDSASLPSPDVLAEEIVEDLRAALEQFEEIGTDLKFPQP